MCINMWSTRALMLLFIVQHGDAWTAVPAHETSYALRTAYTGVDTGLREQDEYELERNKLHSVYRFGWCRPDLVDPSNLRWTQRHNITNPSQSGASFIYFVKDKPLKKLECAVIKVYVARPAMMQKSRVPFGFCKGTVLVMMYSAVRRYQIHEFYVPFGLSVPADVYFELYYP